MKSLEEKKLLARMARNIGQPDHALEASIRREEELNQKLFKPEIVQEQKVVPTLIQELVPNPNSSSGQSLVMKAAEAIHASKEQPVTLQEKLRDAELKDIRKQISELISKMGTLSWGGGGTGVVRFDALDDSRDIFARMDSKVYTFQQDTPPLLANGSDQWINTASGLHYTNINDGMMVIATWVEFGPAPLANVAVPQIPFTSVTSSSYSVANTDYYVGVNYTGNVAILLPTQPEVSNGFICVVKDESGNASGATSWIDIYGTGGDKVDGNDYVRLQIDHGSLTLFYRGGWRII